MKFDSILICTCPKYEGSDESDDSFESFLPACLIGAVAIPEWPSYRILLLALSNKSMKTR
jgi:hypothetical protein